jgi:hypothetical protein
LPYGVRVWFRTRLKTTFWLGTVSLVTTLLLAYLILAVPLRTVTDDMLKVYAAGFPDRPPPLAIVLLDRVVPAGLAVSLQDWAMFLAMLVPLVSLVRGPCLSRLARPSGRWDDLVAGLIAGSAASFVLLALRVPTWMVMLGAIWPREDLELLGASTRQRASARGTFPRPSGSPSATLRLPRSIRDAEAEFSGTKSRLTASPARSSAP